MNWTMRSLFAAGVIAFVLGCPKVSGQGFGLGVQASTNTVTVDSTVSFTINLTNLTGFQLASVSVSNSIAGTASVRFVSFTTSQGAVTTNSNTAIYSLGAMSDGAIAVMGMVVRPTTAGAFSNTVVASATTVTNRAETNVVVQVVPPTSDLAVLLTPPSGPVLVNDWFALRISLTNLGSNAASDVTVTNSGFEAFELLSLAPTNQAFVFTNGLLIASLGILPAGAGMNLQLTLQPTNVGTFALTSSVAAASIVEADPTNNYAVAIIPVGAMVTGELIASNASSMNYDPQTGLMVQTVRLSNIGTNSYDSARVIVSGLTNILYNAVGTNDGDPFVVYGSTIGPGEGVDLAMEYFVPARLPINVPNSAYAAFGIPAVDLQAPVVPPPNITRVVDLGAGGILVEFEAVPHRSYSIIYSGDGTFTNALLAQPPIVAPGDRVQWIDNGPPKTTSHPATSGARFYRVQLNP